MSTAIAPSPAAPRLHRRDSAVHSDATLMAHIADGDPDAFEELYRRYGRRALLQARKLCASRELAEEVAQDAFVSLWRGAHTYRPGFGSVAGWLASMVRNRAIDAWRRSAARPLEVPALDTGHEQLRDVRPVDSGGPDRALALSLIADLPPAQREAVFLAYFGDMTHSEIATFTDAPLGTIKGRVRLGLEKLRHGYDDAGAELACAC